MSVVESAWDALLLSFRAGQEDFRATVDSILIAQRPDVWIGFGHSIFRRIETPNDAFASNVPLMISVLKCYFAAVDHATIRQNLSVPKSFFPWLANVISSTCNSIPLRGTAIVVAGMITQMLPQHSKSFGVLVGAMNKELRRIAAGHSVGSSDSAAVVQPDEIIIHQIVDFLRNVQKSTKVKWVADFTLGISDVHTIMRNKESFRPQCQVEIVQILGKMLDISAGNIDKLEVSPSDWLAIATDIIGGVRRAKVVHDAFTEALYSAIDTAVAAHFWTEDTMLHCCSLCISEIRDQALNTVFDVKVNESLLGLLGVIFEKFNSVSTSATSETIVLNVELVIICMRDLQSKLVLFLSDLRHFENNNIGGGKKKRTGEKIEDFRHACADVRNSAISTAILVTKAVPQWVERYPDLFWDLCTSQLRTPLLFSHFLVEAVSYNELMLQRIIVHLNAALSQIQKYVIKDACTLMLSISDVVSSYQYRMYAAAGSGIQLGIGLCRALRRNPKLPSKSASADESENTIAGWKLTCCNCIDSFIKSVLSLYVAKNADIKLSSCLDSGPLLSDYFCNEFIRTSTDMYITLHKACGLYGGPKGVSMSDRSKAAKYEAENLVGVSHFDALEPILLGISGVINTFFECVILQTSAGLSHWWSVHKEGWREYESLNSLTVIVVHLKYCISSLTRPVRYENDIELMCADIDQVNRGISLLCHWGGELRKNVVSSPREEFVTIESLFDEISSKHFSVLYLLAEFSNALCQILNNIKILDDSHLSEESKCVLFDMTKDALQAAELTLFTTKKSLCSPDFGDKSAQIQELHEDLLSLMLAERFDYTSTPEAAVPAIKFKISFQNKFLDLMNV